MSPEALEKEGRLTGVSRDPKEDTDWHGGRGGCGAEPPGSQGECGGRKERPVWTRANESDTGGERKPFLIHYLGFMPSFLRLRSVICQFSELSCEMIVTQRQIINGAFSFSSENITHTPSLLVMCTNFGGNI